MELYMYGLLFAALFSVGDFSSGSRSSSPNDQRLNCIHSKLSSDIGNDGYIDCYNRNQGLRIPRIKQCMTDYLKKENVVKTAANGQMTVDRAAFASKAEQMKEKHIGRAMIACKNQSNNDRMYQEAARATQCIFEGVKNTCSA